MDRFLNKITCGDNCDLLGLLPRECIDLVVTSPPYDDLRTYGGHTWDFYGVAWQLKRVLKPGGVIVWVVADKTKNGNESGTSMQQALHFQSLGLNLHDTMIWNKATLPLNHNRYEQTFEFMFILSKGKPNTFNGIREKCTSFGRGFPGGSTRQGGDESRARNTQNDVKETKLKGNVWFVDTGFMRATKDKEAYKHPAIFPEQLAQDHILTWSNPDDIVLDPFSGSGTTPKLARELGRQYIGFEVNPEYCEIAQSRLARRVMRVR